jgi:hypothetical protein
VDDWAKFTDYRGYSTDDQVIKWFWQCIRSWPPERKSRLLQFVTGTSRIPVNGFKDLQGSDGPRRFTIEKSGDPSQLPKSHTCFNRVSLALSWEFWGHMADNDTDWFAAVYGLSEFGAEVDFSCGVCIFLFVQLSDDWQLTLGKPLDSAKNNKFGIDLFVL